MKTKKATMACREDEALFAGADTFKEAAGVILRDSRGSVLHKYYQHYTTLDRALKMISSRRLVLSRCDNFAINDQQEPKKFNDASKVLSRTYMACFGHGRMESVAMWGLYGKSNPFALRIMISGEKLRQWMDEIQFVQGKSGRSCAVRKALDTRTFDGGRIVEPESARFGDMLYVAVENDMELDGKGARRSHAVRWENATCHCTDDDLADTVRMYPGWVKDMEWHHERESRLCVRFARPIKANWISIRIPEYVIADMRFTLSPWLDRSLEGFVEEAIVQAIASPRVRPSVHSSVLQGALNFK